MPKPELQMRKDREQMKAWTQKGEVPWTSVDAHAYESQSQAVHIVGFAVGYQDVQTFNKMSNDRTKNMGFWKYDPDLEPPVARPPPTGEWGDTTKRETHQASSAAAASSSGGPEAPSP